MLNSLGYVFYDTICVEDERRYQGDNFTWGIETVELIDTETDEEEVVVEEEDVVVEEEELVVVVPTDQLTDTEEPAEPVEEEIEEDGLASWIKWTYAISFSFNALCTMICICCCSCRKRKTKKTVRKTLTSTQNVMVEDKVRF